ncbi:putative mitochondrial translation system protein [Thermochaetoides thermophila DSM 1495]|uniref:Putative mitochondrial translation system protein n=1 Tax=Chaetomium thermophilum (strain DSM 1495 / CBS 144.50 / IMI 039719) TaxID=759272 RepID=G0SGI4_CHATD|nr:putative mitochondrial translation system protein [Thermochaetoides thermophila DSM 1495]EGS17323.1 putative mitochondrial translation system protein [Thermochaetoides thermophila DSM 1495]
MLQLTRQASFRTLRAPFVCASCRLLLASGAAVRLPAVAARPCPASRQLYSTEPQQQAQALATSLNPELTTSPPDQPEQLAFVAKNASQTIQNADVKDAPSPASPTSESDGTESPKLTWREKKQLRWQARAQKENERLALLQGFLANKKELPDEEESKLLPVPPAEKKQPDPEPLSKSARKKQFKKAVMAQINSGRERAKAIKESRRRRKEKLKREKEIKLKEKAERIAKEGEAVLLEEPEKWEGKRAYEKWEKLMKAKKAEERAKQTSTASQVVTAGISESTPSEKSQAAEEIKSAEGDKDESPILAGQQMSPVNKEKAEKVELDQDTLAPAETAVQEGKTKNKKKKKKKKQSTTQSNDVDALTAEQTSQAPAASSFTEVPAASSFTKAPAPETPQKCLPQVSKVNLIAPPSAEEKANPNLSLKEWEKKRRGLAIETVDAARLKLVPVVKKGQPPVPGLSYGLDRVLFNPGPYCLQDPHSGVYNFDPYLARIMPISEFDFKALKKYVTSSKDDILIKTASELEKKYAGSTSSMTTTLAHFHYLLSAWRPINPCMMSRDFKVDSTRFTRINRAPAATFLHWKDGTYAIDADKEFDTANILSMLGKSMEKLLTLPKRKFEQYRRSRSHELTDKERDGPESYHYTTMGDFLMRSQLDAYDHRLPGTGMFDLKTRAVVSIRMDAQGYQKGVGYEIRQRHGQWESFEREYYDMIRSAFLKYSLQVRMGRMDGIFVAYHNTERIFGFQYIPLAEMDLSLHGQRNKVLGDREFRLSLHLLNKVLDKATAKYPGRTLRIHFETREATGAPFMYIFAKPVTDKEIDEIQGATQRAIEEWERRILEPAAEGEEVVEEIVEDDFDEDLEDEDEEDYDDAVSNATLDAVQKLSNEMAQGGEDEGKMGLDPWEDLLEKVESEMVDEENGVAVVRDAIQDAFQESGLLQEASPEETQRYVDAFLDALTGRSWSAGSKKNETDVTASSESTETDMTPQSTQSSQTPSKASDTKQANLTAVKADAEETSLKDLIVKLATHVKSSYSAFESNEQKDKNALLADQKLRDVWQILFELVEKRGGPCDDPNKILEKGSLAFESVGEEAERVVEKDSVPESTITEVNPESSVQTPVQETSSKQNSEEVEEEEEPEDDPAADTIIPATKVDALGADEEVYGMMLLVRNRVNGKYVERPENMTKQDQWIVEYTIEEIPEQRARNLYVMCLARRKKLRSTSEKEKDSTWYKMFQGKLQYYSRRGRDRRQRLNEKNRLKPVFVYGEKVGYTWPSVFEDSQKDGRKPYKPWSTRWANRERRRMEKEKAQARLAAAADAEAGKTAVETTQQSKAAADDADVASQPSTSQVAQPVESAKLTKAEKRHETKKEKKEKQMTLAQAMQSLADKVQHAKKGELKTGEAATKAAEQAEEQNGDNKVAE